MFVIGDMINLHQLAGVAEVAMQSGMHAARTIKRRVKGKSSERAFRYIDLGSMATIARFRAVVYTGRLRFAGLLGWLAWLFCASHVPDRIQEPHRYACQLDNCLPRTRTTPTHDHPPTTRRTHSTTPGPSAAPDRDEPDPTVLTRCPGVVYIPLSCGATDA